MSPEGRKKGIFISDREHGLPYSKGLTASSLMVTGLGPVKSYQVANQIEAAIRETGRARISREELIDLTLDVLRREAGEEYAQAFIKWQSVAELDIPLIVLIGGATGVGKSTIATQLATRLGITRVVSTDAVREVLRSALTENMFPTLYTSSFDADHAVRQPIPHSGDRLIIGFREQAASVAVGAQRLIDRAIAEGTDMIVEGAHLVPGFLEKADNDQAIVVPILLVVDDEELHRSHFYRRGREARSRPELRYLNAFKKIRRIQKYMVSSAAVRGVPVVSHYDLDATLTKIIEHVLDRALEELGRGTFVAGDNGKMLGRAAQAMDKKKSEGSVKSETIP